MNSHLEKGKKESRLHAIIMMVGLMILGGLPQLAHAEPELKLQNYLHQLKISGDYRLRFDQMHYGKTQGTPSGSSRVSTDRDRFRSRLRVGLDFQFPNNFWIKTRFASGTGEQTSTNQTFTNNASQKALWVDRAYIDWQVVDSFAVQAGRMANPLWTIYASDAIMDTDYNPEGAGQRFSKLMGNSVNVFVNALQGVVTESKPTAKDLYVFTEQIGAEVRLPFESRLKVGYAYHDWKNETVVASSGTAATNGLEPAGKVQEGNRRGSSALANEFGVNEVSADLSIWVAGKPVSLQGTFLKNTRAEAVSLGDKMNEGYQFGSIVGKAKEAKSWEVAYFYKWLEADATVSDITDSDFGDGGTNRYGHIMWVAFNPVEWMTLQTKYFMTQPIEYSLSTNDDINRLQVDCMVRF